MESDQVGLISRFGVVQSERGGFDLGNGSFFNIGGHEMNANNKWARREVDPHKCTDGRAQMHNRSIWQ